MCDPTWILAIANIALVLIVIWQVVESRNTAKELVNESKRANKLQAGVQSWLILEQRLDSAEMKRGRKKLAAQLSQYSGAIHDDITEEVMELFESVATIYNRGFLDEKLAESSFSYHADRYWVAAESYVKEERRRHRDDASLFGEWEAFVKVMRERYDKVIDDNEVKTFLKDEQRLKG